MRTPTWTVLALLALNGCCSLGGTCTDTETETPFDTDTGLPAGCDLDEDLEPGDLVWVRGVHGAEFEYGKGVAGLTDGTVLAAGSHKPDVRFDSGSGDPREVVDDATADGHLVRYSCQGDLEWLQRVSGPNFHEATTLTPLAGGGILLAGDIHGPATFAPGEEKETEVTTLGSEDLFLAWYDDDGTFQHYTHAGGGELDLVPRQVSELGDGSLVVSGIVHNWGSSTDQATFGTDEPNETSLSFQPGKDGFVARFASDGALLWARKLGECSGDDDLTGLAVLSDDSIVVAGTFLGTLLVDEGLGTEAELVSEGRNDIALALLDGDGEVQWVKRIGDWSSDYTHKGLAAYSDGSFALAGSFASTVVFGEGEAHETSLTADGAADVFVARYESDGSLRWVEQAGSAGNEWLNAVAVSPDDSIAVTGACETAMVFGTEASLICEADYDAWVASWDGDGAFRWARLFTGSGPNFGYGVDAVGDAAWAVTGNAYFGAVFGEGEANEITLDNAGEWDAFTALLVH